MTSSTTDRRLGLTAGTAIKAPVVCATTANITLSANQTIDGHLTVTGERVLVKNQTSGVDNGIYVADSGTWTRDLDFDGSNEVVQGTLVLVNGGSTNGGFWYVSTTGTILPGSTSIAFASASVGLATVSAFMQTILSSADATTAYRLLAAAGITLTGSITPTTLAANTDDYAPTGFATASTIRISSSLAINLTGIAAGTIGRTAILHNVGSFAITLKNAATSIAANQFQLSSDYVLNANASIAIEYDATSSKWRMLGQQGTQASVSFNRLVNNVGLSVTMGSSAATIALKDATGADPSSGSPCLINVRSGTLATGTVAQRTVQAALSTVISSGSTGGTTNAVASRVFVAAIDVGGTLELAWFCNPNTTEIPTFDENSLITTIAEGGGGAADSARTWYSTTTRSNVAFTLLGYFDSTQATAGTWATAASTIAVNAPPQRAGMTLLASAIASSSATIDFTSGITAAYDEYLIVIDNLVPASNSTDLWLRFSEDSGSTFKAGASDYRWVVNAVNDSGTNNAAGSTGDTKMRIVNALASTNVSAAEIRVFLPGGTANNKNVSWHLSGVLSGPNAVCSTGAGLFQLDTNAVNGFRLMMSSGNIAQGNFYLYALRKS